MRRNRSLICPDFTYIKNYIILCEKSQQQNGNNLSQNHPKPGSDLVQPLLPLPVIGQDGGNYRPKTGLWFISERCASSCTTT